jgi:hypothetical protein
MDFPFPSFRSRTYRILAVLWTVAIIVALSIPVPDLPEVNPALGPDKIAHVVLFAGFGLLWLRAVRPEEAEKPEEAEQAEEATGTSAAPSHRRPWVRVGATTLVGILFAAGTEVYQGVFMPHRMADPYDAAANVLGLLLAVAAYRLLRPQDFHPTSV